MMRIQTAILITNEFGHFFSLLTLPVRADQLAVQPIAKFGTSPRKPHVSSEPQMRDRINRTFRVGSRAYPGFGYVEPFRQLSRVYHFYLVLIHGHASWSKEKKFRETVRRNRTVTVAP